MSYLKAECSLWVHQKREMNKSRLIQTVASKMALDFEAVEQVVDTLFETIVEEIREDSRVKIRGFGQWYVEEQPERMIYSPHYQRMLSIPPRRKVIFKPGSDLKLNAKAGNEE